MIKFLLILFCVVSLRIRTALSENVFDCGVQQIIINEMIVSGFKTVRGAWPWHVAIHHKEGNGESYACGGTLVTEYHVLTAAHCLKSPSTKKLLTIYDVFVRIGVHQLNSTDNEIQRRMIREIFRTDNFLRQDLRNDIAILQLATKVVFGKYVQPACVSLTKNLTGQLGAVIGWGIDESNKISDDLKSARLPVIDFNTCLASDRTMYGAMLDEGIFCAGYTNGTTVCNGDSGGGLFFEENGAWHLGGIVSFSQKREFGSSRCRVKGYGAFTKIHTYLAWIKSVTKLELPIDDEQYDAKDLNEKAYYANLLPRECGINNMRGAVQQNVSAVFEFPWMAILRYENRSEMDAECVGSLIHNQYVITHAHCTFIEAPYQVRLGEHTIGQAKDCNDKKCAPSFKDYGIEDIIQHPHVLNILTFSDQNKNVDEDKMVSSIYAHVANDIAMIRLNQKVIFGDHIRPVCLPVTQYLRRLALTEYLVTGWQPEPDHLPPSALLKVTVANNPVPCVELQRQENGSADGIMCLSFLSMADKCEMSIGSPLGFDVQYNGLRFVQFGIMFKVFSCDVSFSMSISKHMDWILTNIRP